MERFKQRVTNSTEKKYFWLVYKRQTSTTAWFETQQYWWQIRLLLLNGQFQLLKWKRKNWHMICNKFSRLENSQTKQPSEVTFKIWCNSTESFIRLQLHLTQFRFVRSLTTKVRTALCTDYTDHTTLCQLNGALRAQKYKGHAALNTFRCSVTAWRKSWDKGLPNFITQIF